MGTDYRYPNMTKALQTYLDLRGQHPGYKYAENRGKPTPESEAAVDAWRAEVETAKQALPEGEPQAYYQAHKVWLCRDETATGSEPKVKVSPSGKYRLVVTQHTTGKGTWNYSKGRVYAGEKLIAEVCRNYGSFPFAWVEGHPQGGDYLVGGEDYQGQTVIDLVTGNRVDHLPQSAAQGMGFCWASIHPNADGTLLAVCGCYWGGSYETIIVDFSTPMSPPWPILARDEEDAFDGWTSLDSCKIGTRREVVNLPGHPLYGKTEIDCTLEDLGEVERYCAEHPEVQGVDGLDPGWKEVLTTHEWRRGGSTTEPLLSL